MAEFFDASLAGVRLWLSGLSAEAGRTLVENQPTRGDDNDVDDRGRAPRRWRVSLLFATMPGETEAPVNRLRRLIALVDKGSDDGFTFTSPVEGTCQVRIGDFTYELGQSSRLTASATLVRIGTSEPAVIPLGPAVSPEAGAEAVTAAADRTTTELAAVNLESDVPAAAAAAAERWADPATSPREVFLEVASLTSQIQDEIAALELGGDLQLWPSYKSMVELADQAIGAANAATATAGAVFRLLIDRPTPLRVIAARVYGAALAAERMAEIVRLNDLATPGRVPSGTELIMPATRPSARGA